jgi:hypothetical protein
MPEQSQDHLSGAPPEGRPFTVQTFTARYDPTEDRICLNALDASGAKQAIYLTRRLMDQIIPVVVKLLEEKTPKGLRADIAQSMTQEWVRQVRQTEPPAPPVQVDIETQRWLCTAIQMQKQPAGLAVTLTGEVPCKAQIPLADSHLRTLLDIFRNSYAKAGWNLSVFPDWLEPAKAEAGQGQKVWLN